MIQRLSAVGMFLCVFAANASQPFRVDLAHTASAAEPLRVDLTQFSYLFEAVPLMNRFHPRNSDDRADESRVIQTACIVFSQLLKEDAFIYSIQYFGDESNYMDHLQEIQDIHKDFGKFADFLEAERNILLETGLDGHDVDAMLGEVVAVRSMMDGFDPDPGAILSGLESTTEELCRAQYEGVAKSDRSLLAWKSVLITFGSALLLADAAVVFIPGAGAAVAASSGIFGGLVLTLTFGLL